MLFPLSCLVVASLQLRVLEWLAWCRVGIWSALSSAWVSYDFSVVVDFHQLTSDVASISGLASQQTARRGNIFGILGVVSGILASLYAVGFSSETLTQFTAVAGIGAVVGKCIVTCWASDANNFQVD